jgi:cyclophilin family peptidyl-prolyl cis-trans isomerase
MRIFDFYKLKSFVAVNAKWFLLVCLAILVHLSYNWLSATPTERQRIPLEPPISSESKQNLKTATMTPGRVVELHTSKGRIDFVLFEKDCPKTCARVVSLVKGGYYNGLRFTRVEKNNLIQIEEREGYTSTIPLEVLNGLTNTKGAVGMARSQDPNSAVGSFYILIEPRRDLDYEYCVFGRLIRGMDVVTRIVQNDVINSARVRSLTPEDQKLFYKVLQIESERKVQ